MKNSGNSSLPSSLDKNKKFYLLQEKLVKKQSDEYFDPLSKWYFRQIQGYKKTFSNIFKAIIYIS